MKTKTLMLIQNISFAIQGCEIIIALTHMRTPNDLELAKNCSKIDLILGGHDHVFEVNVVFIKFVVLTSTIH